MTYIPCQCGCRPANAPVPCGCPECSPGPGLDHDGARRRARMTRAKASRTRMQELLRKDPLTFDEETELDGLLHDYIHS